MRIWKQPFSLELLNQMSANALPAHVGIKFIGFGDDYLEATMPVDARTVQPMRMLHGGASVVLAETMGSVASILCLDSFGEQSAVGVEINANHLRGVKEGGMVKAKVKPVRIGRTLHVWQIDLYDEQGRQVCTSRLTTMIINNS